MHKYTIFTVVSALIGLTKADCWSSAMGYACCNGCDVAYEDGSGKWGIENNNWCGIDDKCFNKEGDCWSLPQFPCCKNNVVVYTDGSGDWGFENNNWCGIIKKQPVEEEKECWTLPDYPCCKGNTVVLTDVKGDWGVENNAWCGINKKTDDKQDDKQDEKQEPQQDVVSPKFSMEAGFYEAKDGLSLTLSSSEGTVYYTLDSSDPTTSSTAKAYNGAIRMYDRSIEPNVYSMYQHQENSPFSTTLKDNYIASTNKVDKLTIVRAAVKKSDGTFGPVITKSYIVMDQEKLQFYKEITLVSLVTDPSNLYDKDKGIYVCGQQYLDWKNSPNYNPNKSEWDYDNIANFFSTGKDWERDANIAIFRNGKELKSQDVGIRLKGKSTRNHKFKSFNIRPRKKYGDSKFRADIIEGNRNVINNEEITEYDSFSLRSVGWFDRMREAIVQRALKDYPILATYDNNKSLVFLDGEFWGLYDIIEKCSAEFIESNYSIPHKQVAIIKDYELEEGTEQDFNDFKELVKFCQNNDLTQAQNYKYVSDRVDVDSLIYHYANGLYLGIWDWPNRNFFVYRNNGSPIEGNKYSDGKWRFASFDFDYSSGLTYEDFGGVQGYAHDSFTKFQKKKDEHPTPLFTYMMKNKEFQQKFVDVFYLMGEEIFGAQKMKSIVQTEKDKYLKFVIKTDWRWYGGTPNMSYNEFFGLQTRYYGGGYDDIATFFTNRAQYAYRFLKNTYGFR